MKSKKDVVTSQASGLRKGGAFLFLVHHSSHHLAPPGKGIVDMSRTRGADIFRPFICLWGQLEGKPIFLVLMLGLEKGGWILGTVGIWALLRLSLFPVYINKMFSSNFFLKRKHIKKKIYVRKTCNIKNVLNKWEKFYIKMKHNTRRKHRCSFHPQEGKYICIYLYISKSSRKQHGKKTGRKFTVVELLVLFSLYFRD